MGNATYKNSKWTNTRQVRFYHEENKFEGGERRLVHTATFKTREEFERTFEQLHEQQPPTKGWRWFFEVDISL